MGDEEYRNSILFFKKLKPVFRLNLINTNQVIFWWGQRLGCEKRGFKLIVAAMFGQGYVMIVVAEKV